MLVSIGIIDQNTKTIFYFKILGQTSPLPSSITHHQQQQVQHTPVHHPATIKNHHHTATFYGSGCMMVFDGCRMMNGGMLHLLLPMVSYQRTQLICMTNDLQKITQLSKISEQNVSKMIL